MEDPDPLQTIFVQKLRNNTACHLLLLVTTVEFAQNRLILKKGGKESELPPIAGQAENSAWVQ